jgi:hypothetical protein
MKVYFLIQLVLHLSVTLWERISQAAYIVPVFSTHLERSISFWVALTEVAITDNILKGMAAPPVTSASSRILLHRVLLCKIVPGSKKIDGFCT